MTIGDLPSERWSRRSLLAGLSSVGAIAGFSALESSMSGHGGIVRAQTAQRPSPRIVASPAAPAETATYSVTIENIAARGGESAVDQVALNFAGSGISFDGVQRTAITAVLNPGTSPTPLVVTQTRTRLAGERPTIGISRASGQPRVSEGDTLQLRIPGVRNPPVGGEFPVGVQLNELATGQQAGLLDARTTQLTITPGTATVEGTVTDTVGDPITQPVTLEDADGTVVGTAEPTPTGDFTVEDVPPGTYDLVVDSPGYEPERIPDVTVDPDDVVAVAAELEPAVGVLEATIVGTNTPVPLGDPVEAAVTITNEGAGTATEAILFEFVEADGDIVASDTEDVTIEAGESEPLTVEFETEGFEPGEYSVRVTTPDDVTAVFVTLVVTDFGVELVGAGDATEFVDPVVDPVEPIDPIDDLEELEDVDPETVIPPVEDADTVDEVEVVPELETLDPETLEAVDALEPEPVFERGETAVVVATATNGGPVPETQHADFLVDGDLVDTESVTLEPGEAEPVVFEWATVDVEPGPVALEVAVGDEIDVIPATVVEPASFVVDSDPEAIAEPVEAGDVLSVPATVTNVGDVADAQTVELLVDDAEVDAEAVALEPDETDTVILEWDTTGVDPGVYEIGVAIDGHLEVFDPLDPTEPLEGVPVTVVGPAEFAIDLVDADPAVERGEPVETTATVLNDGPVAEAQQIALVLDDGVEERVVDEEQVQLAPGEEAAVDLVWDTATVEPGTYDLAVRSADDEAVAPVDVLEPGFLAVEVDVPPTVDADEPLEVSATIENVGETPADEDVLLLVDGRIADAETVALEPGETATVPVAWTPTEDDLGIVDLTVATPDADDRAPIGVVGPAAFDVAVADADEAIEPGETTRVAATVTNDGPVAERQRVALVLADEVLDVQTVALAPGETTEIILEWAADVEPGTYDLAVRSADATARVSIRVLELVRFAFEHVEAKPVGPSKPFEARATVTNDGPVSERRPVVLAADGRGVAAEHVALEPGASERLAVRWTEPGRKRPAEEVEFETPDSGTRPSRR